jgi:hypothetical protein
MSESSIPMPIFDRTVSQTLAYADIKAQVIDYAINIGEASSLDGLGVAYALFPPEKFEALFGTPPQPRPPMGPCGQARAGIAEWTASNLLKTQQKAKEVQLKAALVSIFPKELLTPLEDEHGSLRSRSTEYIFSALDAQLGLLTSADLDVLHARLKKPYDRTLPVESFVATFQTTLRALTRAQQPISNNMAMGTLQACFSPEWAQCWVKFVSDYPVVTERTVANLCRAIIIFARDALPILSAQQAIGISLAKSQDIDEVIGLREEVAALRAFVATIKKQSQPPDGTRANTRARAAWRDMPLKDRSFCWSCGPCGHISADCRTAKPGHQVAATFRHQMQSTWKAMFTSKGWPTI